MRLLTLGSRIIALCLVTVAGCATGPGVESSARLRAANEFSCPRELVKLRYLSDDTVHVEACGHQATYTCFATNRTRWSWDRPCVREATSSDEAPPR